MKHTLLIVPVALTLGLAVWLSTGGESPAPIPTRAPYGAKSAAGAEGSEHEVLAERVSVHVSEESAEAKAGTDTVPAHSLRVLDSDREPVGSARLGVIRAGENEVVWVADCDDSGLVRVPGSYAEQDWVVVEGPEALQLLTRPADLVFGEVVLPERVPTKVRVEGLGDRAASVWLGMHRDAPRLASAPMLGPWRVRFAPVMKRIDVSEPLILLPTAAVIGLQVQVRAEGHTFAVDSVSQPFESELVFRATPVTQPREYFEIAIEDERGVPMDIPATAHLVLPGGVSLEKRFTGELSGDRAFDVRRRDGEVQLFVRTKRGDSWRRTFTVDRTSRQRIVLTAPASPPGFTMARPNWQIEGLYALFTGGKVRYIASCEEAVDEKATWVVEGRRIRVVGARGFESLWCIGVDGQATVYRPGAVDSVELPVVGLERVDAERVARRLGSRRGTIRVAFEIQIPGQTCEHWIRIDAVRLSSAKDLAWSKVRTRGVRARVRCVVSGESHEIAAW